jgi:hypothetical protein
MLVQEWRSCASCICRSQQRTFTTLHLPRFSPISCPTRIQIFFPDF